MTSKASIENNIEICGKWLLMKNDYVFCLIELERYVLIMDRTL